MSKARIIGAGSAGSTIYHCNVNLNTAGGTKKQGLPFLLNAPTYNKRHVSIKAVGGNRNTIFNMNQLTGGVGYTTRHPNDGVHQEGSFTYVPAKYPRGSNAPTTPPSKHLGRYWSGRPLNLNRKGMKPESY